MAFRRAGTTIDPEGTTTTIVPHGQYRFSRNPVYLGLFGVYIGVAIAVNTVWPLIFLPVMFVLITMVIRQGERYLERSFAAEYLN